ncbi:MAG TPA: hypothetical protein VH560_02240 [Polyangia bacterium]|jgi:hypothetical protein|nr:hypothetical protein [Polyangia bacterium]
MITDRAPRSEKKRAEFDRSDALVTMPLPPATIIQPLALGIKTAMEGEELKPVTYACAELLAALSAFYSVPTPPVAVLGVRPHKVMEGVTTYQLFGDYTPSTQCVRVWMRTAIRAQVSSPKALLNTLLHEFCHHLDCTRLKCPESYHTRGFFWRIDHLYHCALGTPPERRRPLKWIQRGSVWSIDWARTRTTPQ